MSRTALSLAVLALAAVGCDGPDATASVAGTPVNAAVVAAAGHQHSDFLSDSAIPGAELAKVRRASAHYHDIDSALADGYVDINVVVPNMGRHFMKPSLVDATFDAEHPELLVYQTDPSGRLVLGAVEYAIPLDSSVNAPDGFTGSADVWDPNTGFGLWLLHAWVWRENPDGVFQPTNQRVP